MRKFGIQSQQDDVPLTGTSSRMRSLPVADVSRLNFHSITPPQPMQPHLIRPDPNIVPAADADEVVVNRKCVYTYEDKYTFARILVSDSLVFGTLSHRTNHLRCHTHVHALIYMYTMLCPQIHTLRAEIFTAPSASSLLMKCPRVLLAEPRTILTICIYTMMYILLDTRNGFTSLSRIRRLVMRSPFR